MTSETIFHAMNCNQSEGTIRIGNWREMIEENGGMTTGTGMPGITIPIPIPKTLSTSPYPSPYPAGNENSAPSPSPLGNGDPRRNPHTVDKSLLMKVVDSPAH
ncbi:hypothetical protein LXL04_002383 [Taraxacum kok-saghyz]